jgi:hypothetical protein
MTWHPFSFASCTANEPVAPAAAVTWFGVWGSAERDRSPAPCALVWCVGFGSLQRS